VRSIHHHRLTTLGADIETNVLDAAWTAAEEDQVAALERGAWRQ
jgi:hypothetical protein